MLEQLISLFEYVTATLGWMLILILLAVEVALVITLVCVVIKIVIKEFKRKGE
jgi:hypothetical protein